MYISIWIDFIGAGVLLPLPWSIRMKIAFGAAKGLTFLHEAEKPVIYSIVILRHRTFYSTRLVN